MYYVIPNDPNLPQLGPFDNPYGVFKPATAAFGPDGWKCNTEQDTTRASIEPESAEWKALVADQIVASRHFFERHCGNNARAEMATAYLARTDSNANLATGYAAIDAARQRLAAASTAAASA